MNYHMQKGDIVWGRALDKIRPIVFLRDASDELFIGAMLTTSDEYPQNVLMKPEHFKTVDSEGKPCEIKFENTHIVQTELVKRKEWVSFDKGGELTPEGIGFVEGVLKSSNDVLWQDYVKPIPPAA